MPYNKPRSFLVCAMPDSRLVYPVTGFQDRFLPSCILSRQDETCHVFAQMMSEQYSDDNVVQTASEAAETTKKCIDDWPNAQFRYQTSDMVKGAASDRWKDPTGYSLIEKYGRSAFSSQDLLPKDQAAS